MLPHPARLPKAVAQRNAPLMRNAACTQQPMAQNIATHVSVGTARHLTV